MVQRILSQNHPRLVLISFKQPDTACHANDWAAYVQSIRDMDEYVWKLWQFLQRDSFYAGKTALFVTNDHGRHLDWVANGFIGHGDNCEGCQRINLFAAGPDFKQRVVLDKARGQIDIPRTVAELMGFSMPENPGEVLWEMFNS